jgi:hypothetical protein
VRGEDLIRLAPSKRSNGLESVSPIPAYIASSQWFTARPPCANPPVGSSSGPPGACMTPSRVTNAGMMTGPNTVPISRQRGEQPRHRCAGRRRSRSRALVG